MVKESRVYSLWKADGNGGTVNADTGILAAKAKLNQLHQELADQGFNQVTLIVKAVIQRMCSRQGQLGSHCVDCL